MEVGEATPLPLRRIEGKFDERLRTCIDGEGRDLATGERGEAFGGAAGSRTTRSSGHFLAVIPSHPV